jgi:hypothetical protein
MKEIIEQWSKFKEYKKLSSNPNCLQRVDSDNGVLKIDCNGLLKTDIGEFLDWVTKNEQKET